MAAKFRNRKRWLFRAFFALGLFSLPWRVQTLVWVAPQPEQFFFNEYTAFWLYLTEICWLIALLSLGLDLLLKGALRESFLRPGNWREELKSYLKPEKRGNHREGKKVFKKWRNWLKWQPEGRAVFCLVLASLLVLPFAQEPSLAGLHLGRLLLGLGAAGVLAAGFFPAGLARRILLVSFGLQALLALAQFGLGGSVGFHFLGESFFETGTFNVGKIEDLAGTVWVRGMGSLAHANILGGLLVLVFFLGLDLKRKAGWEWAGLLLLCLGILVSFSRAAFWALGFGLVWLMFWAWSRRFRRDLVLVAFGLGFLIFIFWQPLAARFQGVVADLAVRYEQVEQAFTLAHENFFGVGRGSYTAALGAKFPTLNNFELQPVHNFFVLKWTEESGLVALAWLILLGCLGYRFWRSQNYPGVALVWAVFWLANLDHYFSTSFAGQMLLVVALGLCLRPEERRGARC